MDNRFAVTAWDVFSVGMIHRILVGAAPGIKGASMLEKQRDLECNFDWLRQATVCGTANNPNLVGVLLTEAVDPTADVGVIYFVKEGYLAMCGSGTFAIGTFLVESGMIEATGSRVEITLELMTGLMRLDVEIENGKVERVNTVTEPVFHVGQHKVDVPGFGLLEVDVAYCLNFFESQVNAAVLDIEVSNRNRAQLIALGVAVRDIINRDMSLQHPLNAAIDRAVQTLIYSRLEGSEELHFRNVAIYGKDGFDLTPSGTSTCAFMSTCHAHGTMKQGDQLRMIGVSDAVIDGRVEGTTKVGDHNAIIPRISGTGRIASLTTVFA